MLTLLVRSEKAAHERPDGDGQTREPHDPDRPPRVAPEMLTGAQADRDTARLDHEQSRDGGPSW